MKTVTVKFVVPDSDADSLMSDIANDIGNDRGTPFISSTIEDSTLDELDALRELVDDYIADEAEKHVGDRDIDDDRLVGPCPFCGDKRWRKLANLTGETSDRYLWSCGTSGPDINGEYATGSECDKTCFRNGFLRCRDLLVRIVDGATAMSFRGDGWVVPEELMDEIRSEVEKA